MTAAHTALVVEGFSVKFSVLKDFAFGRGDVPLAYQSPLARVRRVSRGPPGGGGPRWGVRRWP
ncbi:hypothetical protein ADK43_12370 [Streptomyces rimosus subsp. rimosus]|nr:hypothetical protein ADK43_12370 [Streptomyces rimosus subsp. rimosus]